MNYKKLAKKYCIENGIKINKINLTEDKILNIKFIGEFEMDGNKFNILEIDKKDLDNFK